MVVTVAPSGGTSPLHSDTNALARPRPLPDMSPITSPSAVEGIARKTKSARDTPFATDSIRSGGGSSTPGRYFAFSRDSASVEAWTFVRVCSVARTPARASSTAIAVPNEPAPITIARLPGSEAWARLSTAGRLGSGAFSAISRDEGIESYCISPAARAKFNSSCKIRAAPRAARRRWSADRWSVPR